MAARIFYCDAVHRCMQKALFVDWVRWSVRESFPRTKYILPKRNEVRTVDQFSHFFCEQDANFSLLFPLPIRTLWLLSKNKGITAIVGDFYSQKCENWSTVRARLRLGSNIGRENQLLLWVFVRLAWHLRLTSASSVMEIEFRLFTLVLINDMCQCFRRFFFFVMPLSCLLLFCSFFTLSKNNIYDLMVYFGNRCGRRQIECTPSSSVYLHFHMSNGECWALFSMNRYALLRMNAQIDAQYRHTCHIFYAKQQRVHWPGLCSVSRWLIPRKTADIFPFVRDYLHECVCVCLHATKKHR